MVSLVTTVGDLNLNQRELNLFLNAPGGHVDRDIQRRANRVARGARRQVGKDSGSLARSITVSRSVSATGPEYSVGTSHRLARIHHDGTRPHLVHAKRAQMLRLQSRGRVVYARTVFHPGTKPNRFLTDNLKLAYL